MPDLFVREMKNDDIKEHPSYYSRFTIQPIDFISANKIDFLAGNVIKYVCRYDAKNGVEDLKKAKVYLEKLIERTEKEENK